jgi:hypothetical protein
MRNDNALRYGDAALLACRFRAGVGVGDAGNLPSKPHWSCAELVQSIRISRIQMLTTNTITIGVDISPTLRRFFRTFAEHFGNIGACAGIPGFFFCIS